MCSSCLVASSPERKVLSSNGGPHTEPEFEESLDFCSAFELCCLCGTLPYTGAGRIYVAYQYRAWSRTSTSRCRNSAGRRQGRRGCASARRSQCTYRHAADFVHIRNRCLSRHPICRRVASPVKCHYYPFKGPRCLLHARPATLVLLVASPSTYFRRGRHPYSRPAPCDDASGCTLRQAYVTASDRWQCAVRAAQK